MKSKILSLVVLLFFVSNVASAQNNFKRYPFKSAIITYKLDGKTKGTKTVYIDNYGKNEATYETSEIKVWGRTTKTNKASIVDGSKLYQIDFEKNKVSSMTNPGLQMYGNSNMSDQELISSAEKTLEANGFNKTGKKVFLGKNCDVWEGMSTMYTWKGLTLYSYMKMMGIKVIEEATDFKVNVKIPKDKLKVPAGVEQDEDQAFIDQMTGEDDEDMENEEGTMSMEDLRKMKYSDYRKMMKEADPSLTDAEIKQRWDKTQEFLKMTKK